MRDTQKNFLVIIGLLLVLLLLGGATYLYLNSATHRVASDAPARKVFQSSINGAQYQDLNGEEIALDDTIGSIVVAYSWASWCPQCAEDLPVLSQVSNELSDNDITFLAVNRAENRYTAQRFLDTLPELPGLQIILDPSDQLFTINDSYAMPETVVYGSAGEILLQQRGQLRVEELREILEGALEE